jgi:hypothetical protein
MSKRVSLLNAAFAKFNVTFTPCVTCYRATHAVEIFHLFHFVFGLSPSVLRRVALRCQLQHLFDTHFHTTAFPTAVCVPFYVCLVKDAVTTSRRCVASNYHIAVCLDLERIRMQTLVACCIVLLLYCLEELCKTTKMRTVVSVEVRTEYFLKKSTAV